VYSTVICYSAIQPQGWNKLSVSIPEVVITLRRKTIPRWSQRLRQCFRARPIDFHRHRHCPTPDNSIRCKPEVKTVGYRKYSCAVNDRWFGRQTPVTSTIESDVLVFWETKSIRIDSLSESNRFELRIGMLYRNLVFSWHTTWRGNLPRYLQHTLWETLAIAGLNSTIVSYRVISRELLQRCERRCAEGSENCRSEV